MSLTLIYGYSYGPYSVVYRTVNIQPESILRFFQEWKWWWKLYVSQPMLRYDVPQAREEYLTVADRMSTLSHYSTDRARVNLILLWGFSPKLQAQTPVPQKMIP